MVHPSVLTLWRSGQRSALIIAILPAINRCDWGIQNDPLYLAYHDEEWGAPSHDERHLFELLTLEGAQAGLSWSTILKKREGYRKAFAGFEADRVARFDRRRIERLLQNPAIVRNRLKIEAAINNARRALEVRDQFETLDAYLWQFVEGKPIVGRWRTVRDIPAETDQSRTMSRDLRGRGFRFVGPTICYAFMQAAGLVNDHVVACFRFRELAKA
jgi:DNA-3-methyladenine glycosylase I